MFSSLFLLGAPPRSGGKARRLYASPSWHVKRSSSFGCLLPNRRAPLVLVMPSDGHRTCVCFAVPAGQAMCQFRTENASESVDTVENPALTLVEPVDNFGLTVVARVCLWYSRRSRNGCGQPQQANLKTPAQGHISTTEPPETPRLARRGRRGRVHSDPLDAATRSRFPQRLSFLNDLSTVCTGPPERTPSVSSDNPYP